MFISANDIGKINQRGSDLDLIEPDNPHKRVMIIDDEVDTICLIKHILISAGIDVISASNGPEALEKISRNGPDVILLDLLMPGMSGWQVYEELRRLTDAPVMIISALSEKEEVVRGLRIGADDFISKPFYPSELVARINRVTRQRRQLHPSQVFKFPVHGLEIDCNTREVKYEGRLSTLPAREFGVLAALARRPGRWVDLSVIASEVWNDSKVHIQNRIKYMIFLLRSHLENDPRNPRLILSREGLGYKLAVAPGLDSKNERG
ncbi:MAG TPA: response regulator transcription factor [Leptolinea sp.]